MDWSTYSRLIFIPILAAFSATAKRNLHDYLFWKAYLREGTMLLWISSASFISSATVTELCTACTFTESFLSYNRALRRGNKYSVIVYWSSAWQITAIAYAAPHRTIGVSSLTSLANF